MGEPVVQVTIINDSRLEACEASCGVDWSSPETVARARRQISERFGKSTELRYADLAEAGSGRETDEWHKMIRDRNLSLPVLLVNGQPRISGQFDIRQLLDAIEAAMEIGEPEGNG